MNDKKLELAPHKLTKRIYFFVFLFVNICFASCYSQSHWTNKKTGELWRIKPENVDECITRLDSILAVHAKDHFKNTPEDIAVIEICFDLQHSFIRGWQLSNQSKLTWFFKELKIYDPPEMLRIIFSCYHKKINIGSYDLTSVIKQYESYWVGSRTFAPPGQISPNDYWVLNDKMVNREDSLMNKYLLDRTNLRDVVEVSYYYEHYFSSKPKRYDLQGIVIAKDSLKNLFSIKIAKISNEKNNPIWYDNKVKRMVGDTIEVKPKAWHITGESRFHYW